MNAPLEKKQTTRPVQRPDPGMADIARGANGLGEIEDTVQVTHAMTGMMSAGMHGALAIGLSGAAMTLGMMARLTSFGAGLRRNDEDKGDGGAAG
ncbi:hypothetical protein KUV73_05415 [Mameliella alba]|nr:hypothetical protein [Mameliella alba]MBY6168990.1 hypothetical protein [Mameliella alba]MBY6173789.1 hypothetical protein [Mameliella alba]